MARRMTTRAYGRALRGMMFLHGEATRAMNAPDDLEQDIETIRAELAEWWALGSALANYYERWLRARRVQSIRDLIDRSSLGAALRNIRENGIDADLADLEDELHGGRRQ